MQDTFTKRPWIRITFVVIALAAGVAGLAASAHAESPIPFVEISAADQVAQMGPGVNIIG